MLPEICQLLQESTVYVFPIVLVLVLYHIPSHVVTQHYSQCLGQRQIQLIPWYGQHTFYFLHSTYTFFGNHPVSCSASGGKWPGHKTDIHFYLVPSSSAYIFTAQCLFKHRNNYTILYFTNIQKVPP